VRTEREEGIRRFEVAIHAWLLRVEIDLIPGFCELRFDTWLLRFVFLWRLTKKAYVFCFVRKELAWFDFFLWVHVIFFSVFLRHCHARI
jgi:hypothetical protein